MLRLLNELQYRLQKPWRFILKDRKGFIYGLNRVFKIISLLILLTLWVILTPLRVLNAFFYNVLIHGMWSFRDNFQDIFVPKTNGMRHRRGFMYFIYWIFGLPFRVLKYGWRGVIQLLEGIIFTFFDTIFPTLTMYHGTGKSISLAQITKPGEWLVGTGNYAGSGLYFAMSKRTAKHYAEGKDGGGAIIRARVTPGRILNLSLVPIEIRNLVANNGNEITKWSKKKGYNCTEWWRKDSGWWEYCL